MYKNVAGVITYLYKNCPKINGWFGCVFDTAKYGSIKIEGKTSISICKGMKLVCNLEKLDKIKGNFNDFKAVSVSLERSFMNECLYIGNISPKAKMLLPKLKQMAITEKKGLIDFIVSEQDKILPLFKTNAGSIDEQARDSFVMDVYSPLVFDDIRNAFPDLSTKAAESLVDRYGYKALSIISADPYQPLFDRENIPYYKWKQAEIVAKYLGVLPDSKRRIYAALVSAIIKLQADYHQTCVNMNDDFNRRQVISYTNKLLDFKVPITDEDVNNSFLLPDSPLVADYRNGNYYVYTRLMKKIETSCLNSLNYILSQEPLITPFLDSPLKIFDYIKEYENKTGMLLDNGQTMAVMNCLTNRMSILCGGPGCGKTAVISCILYCWYRITKGRVSLSAPTWMAVNRTKESVARCQVNKYQPEDCVSTVAGRVFRYGDYSNGYSSGNPEFYDYVTFEPLSCFSNFSSLIYNNNIIFNDNVNNDDFVLAIIDESSMISLNQAAKLLQMYKFAQIIWVGDNNQLPSISAGDFFGDICSSKKIPCSILRVNHRANSSEIVTNARSVLNGDYLGIKYVDGIFNRCDFLPVNNFTPVACADMVVNRYVYYLDKLIKEGKSMYDIVVLSPTKKKNYVGSTVDINKRLQDKLNPPLQLPCQTGVEIKLKGFVIPVDDKQFKNDDEKDMPEFRIGDKVVCIRNRVKDGRTNGDVGEIIGYFKPDENQFFTQEERNKKKNQSQMIVKMQNGNILYIPREYFCEFDLGYALTVHKAQGTGYSVVLFVSQHEPMYWGDFLSRNLLYTAITRAEDTVEIFGSYKSFCYSVSNPSRERFSLLPTYIDELFAESWDNDNIYESYIDERYLL